MCGNAVGCDTVRRIRIFVDPSLAGAPPSPPAMCVTPANDGVVPADRTECFHSGMYFSSGPADGVCNGGGWAPTIEMIDNSTTGTHLQGLSNQPRTSALCSDLSSVRALVWAAAGHEILRPAWYRGPYGTDVGLDTALDCQQRCAYTPVCAIRRLV